MSTNKFTIDVIKHYSKDDKECKEDCGLVEILVNNNIIEYYDHHDDDPLGLADAFISGMQFILDTQKLIDNMITYRSVSDLDW